MPQLHSHRMQAVGFHSGAAGFWTSVDADEDPRALLLYQWAGFVPVEARADDA